tara:strand:+ start:2333 stop:2857 length:525 start_codon:yes stop_codon:yes gene_type:complete
VKKFNPKKIIRAWSKEVLEPKSDFHNGLPACPFAKKSWLNERVKIQVCQEDDWSDLTDSILKFDDSIDVLIYVNNNWDHITDTEFDARVDIINALGIKLDLWVMSSHPNHEDKPGFENNEDLDPHDSMYMVFVQKHKELVDASDKIKKLGYYSNWSKEVFNEFIIKRKIKCDKK